MPDLEPLKKIARDACAGADSAHDWQHVLRVAAGAAALCAAEGADADIAVPAALLHELVNLPKNHPESSRSGELCAERALTVLGELGWPAEQAERIAYC